MSDSEQKPRRLRDLEDAAEKLKDGSPDRLLTKADVALILNKSVSWLETKAVRSGPDAIPFFRLSPGSVRVRLGDLRAWCVKRLCASQASGDTPTVVSIEPVRAQLKTAINRNRQISEEFARQADQLADLLRQIDEPATTTERDLSHS